MTRAVPRTRLLYASLLLCAASAGHAQNAPANVVTPAPPPREGTVGPEQLRDFSLPGTRTTPEQATPAPPAEQPAAPPRQAPTSVPPAAREPAPAPAPRSRETVALPAPAGRPAPTQARPSAPSAGAVTVDLGAPIAIPNTPATPAFEALPAPTLPSPLPPPPSLETAEVGAPWWPWAVAAALGLLALALVWRRQRPCLAFAAPGHFDDAPEPSPPLPEPDARPFAGPASEPPLPAGMVTTRLRSSKPAPPPQPPARPQESQAPVGAVVSTRLRPFVDLNLAVDEVVLDEGGALMRLRLTVSNVGTAAARDIVIEALPLNAGEGQSTEISAFHQRPAVTEQGMAELPRLASTEIVHEVRMLRGAMREYEAQGRRLFVPILAFNAHYRWSQGTGRTGAAFLLGHERRDSERLAPLRLDGGTNRLTGIGVRKLEEAVRR